MINGSVIEPMWWYLPFAYSL